MKRSVTPPALLLLLLPEAAALAAPTPAAGPEEPALPVLPAGERTAISKFGGDGPSSGMCSDGEDTTINDQSYTCVDGTWIRIDERMEVTGEHVEIERQEPDVGTAPPLPPPSPPPPTPPPPTPPPTPPPPPDDDDDDEDDDDEERIDIVLRAYIPSAWVPSAPAVRCLRRGKDPKMIFGGDGRGPSPTPQVRRWGTPRRVLQPYRLQAELVLEAPSEQSALRLVSQGYSAGLTTQFHKKSTLLDGVINRLDYDQTEDCDRLDRTAQLTGTLGSATLRGRAALALELRGGNPLVFSLFGLLDINAEVELDFRTSATGALVVDGEISHDCMPAFELYVKGATAYRWNPSPATLTSQTGIVGCLRPPNDDETGRVRCTENSQGEFTCSLQ